MSDVDELTRLLRDRRATVFGSVAVGTVAAKTSDDVATTTSADDVELTDVQLLQPTWSRCFVDATLRSTGAAECCLATISCSTDDEALNLSFVIIAVVSSRPTRMSSAGGQTVRRRRLIEVNVGLLRLVFHIGTVCR